MPATKSPRSSIFRTAELAVGGNLKKYLRDARRAGKTFNDISADLRVKNVIITYEGVRAWCIRLGVAG